MQTNNIDILSLWWETGGLIKMRVDFIFTIIKLLSIYSVTSIPFWLEFNKQDYDVSNVVLTPKYTGLWVYYTITYMIMSFFFVKTLWQKMKRIASNYDYFHEMQLDIYTTEGTTIDFIYNKLQLSRDEFLLQANRFDNILIALDDKKFLDVWIFKSLLGTIPLEYTIRFVLNDYFNGTNLFKNVDQNNIDFKAYCKKRTLVLLPFIPTIFVFTVCNHILTFVNNGNFLSTYDFNRYAVWRFRLYNEFMIGTRKRLDKLKPYVKSIMNNLYLENWSFTFSKGVSFLSSVLSVFLIIFSFIGYERFFGIDIIPLIGLFVLLSTCLFTRVFHEDSHMSSLRLLLKKDLTKYELADYVESKWKILLKECVSILFIPIVLFYILPDKSFLICNFYSCFVKQGICSVSFDSDKSRASRQQNVLESDLLMV